MSLQAIAYRLVMPYTLPDCDVVLTSTCLTVTSPALGLQRWVSGSLDQDKLELLTRWSTQLTGQHLALTARL